MWGRKRNAVSLLVKLLLILAILYSGWLPNSHVVPEVKASPSVSDGWYYSGWNYRKEHNITGTSAGNQTNYQMRIKVRYGNETEYVARFLTNWTKYSGNPVVDPGDSRVWCAVKYYNNTFHLYLGHWSTGSNITYWTSTNGINFTEHPNSPVLTVGTTGSWNETALEPHSIIHFNGEWRLYYGGKDATGYWRIGYAVINSSDWSDLTPYSGNPVLVPTGGENTVADPHVVVFQNKVYLYYQYDGGGWNPAVCESTDGITFENKTYFTHWRGVDALQNTTDGITFISTIEGSTNPKGSFFIREGYILDGSEYDAYSGNPVLDSNASIPWESANLGHAAMTKANGTYYLYYVANDDNGTRRLGLATTTTWTNVSLTVYGKGEYVFLNEKSRTDFGDVRFTWYNYTSGEEQEIDYWMDTSQGADGDWRYFWVELPEISNAATNTIYIYYGKSNAATTSSISNTFVFGDDFDDGDITDWTINAPTGTSVTVSTTQYVSSPYSVEMDDQSSTAYATFSDTFATQTSTFSFTFYAYPIATDDVLGFKLGDSTSINRIIVYFRSTGWISWHDGTAWNDFMLYTANTWYKLELIVDVGTDTYDIYVNDTLKVNGATFYSSATWLEKVEYLCGNNAVLGTYYIDNNILRKYVDPEPTHGAWGAEEALLQLINFFGLINPTFQISDLQSFSFSPDGLIAQQLTIEMQKTASFNLFSPVTSVFSVTLERSLAFVFLSEMTQVITLSLQRTFSFTLLRGVDVASTIGYSKAMTFSLFGTVTPATIIQGAFISAQILNLFGAIGLAFAIDLQKTLAFSLSSLITPAITIDGASSFVSTQILNFYGSIAQSLTIGMQKTVAFSLISIVTVIASVGSQAQLVSSQILNFFGSIVQIVSSSLTKSVAFTLHSPLTSIFTIESASSFISSQILNLFGSIGQAISILLGKTWSFSVDSAVNPAFIVNGLSNFVTNVLNLFGSVSASLRIDGWTSLPVPSPPVVYATRGFVVAVAVAFMGVGMSLSIIFMSRNRKQKYGGS